MHFSLNLEDKKGKVYYGKQNKLLYLDYSYIKTGKTSHFQIFNYGRQFGKKVWSWQRMTDSTGMETISSSWKSGQWDKLKSDTSI